MLSRGDDSHPEFVWMPENCLEEYKNIPPATTSTTCAAVVYVSPAHLKQIGHLPTPILSWGQDERQMPLGREDATRIIRFCMAGSGWGTATRDDDGLCVVKIVQTTGLDAEADRFDGATFEEAMRLAADAGKLKSSCLEKQIAFLARSLPDAQAGADVELPRDAESTSARAEGRLFPTITSLMTPQCLMTVLRPIEP